MENYRIPPLLIWSTAPKEQSCIVFQEWTDARTFSLNKQRICKKKSNLYLTFVLKDKVYIVYTKFHHLATTKK